MKNQRYKPLNLDFEKFFSGKVIAKGNLMLKYPKKSVKNLHVTFKGSFKNNNLKLSEQYLENNNKIVREWNFRKLSKNLFYGKEKSVKGKIVVHINRNMLTMQYRFKLILWKFTTFVLIKDYMYLINEKEIVNTTYVSKLGINLAKIVLLYKKIS